MEVAKQKAIKSKFSDYLGVLFKLRKGLPEISSAVMTAAFFGDKKSNLEQFIQSLGLRRASAPKVIAAFKSINLTDFALANDLEGEELSWFMEKAKVFIQIQEKLLAEEEFLHGNEFLNVKLKAFARNHIREMKMLYHPENVGELMMDMGKSFEQKLESRFINDWDGGKLNLLNFDEFNSLWMGTDLVPALIICHKRGRDISGIFN